MYIKKTESLQWFNKGFWAELEKKYFEAAYCYTQAIRLNPDLAHAYYNRGNFYNKLGHLKFAHLDYSRALQIEPQMANSTPFEVVSKVL